MPKGVRQHRLYRDKGIDNSRRLTDHWHEHRELTAELLTACLVHEEREESPYVAYHREDCGITTRGRRTEATKRVTQQWALDKEYKPYEQCKP